jgi:hypothetical protein
MSDDDLLKAVAKSFADAERAMCKFFGRPYPFSPNVLDVLPPAKGEEDYEENP